MLAELGGVEVAGEAANGREALERIDRLRPELLLLDIRMPELDGLALAARWTGLPPVIFVTAFDEHAIQAFEVGAIDYLLKPVRRERLEAAIERARTRILPAAESFRALPSREPELPRIITHEGGSTRLFDAREITRFWASDKYTLFLAEGKEQLTAEPLSALEERLRPFGFLRIHRAELVRAAAIRALSSESGIHEVELLDGQRARVSRRSIALLRAELGL
jgi:DNA-binding LytR/AlgR family response regulator